MRNHPWGMTYENKRRTIEENKQLIASRLKYIRIKAGYAKPTASPGHMICQSHSICDERSV